ncbi:MAG: aromatic amino acid ammonia-lyase, partial [Lacipirellulaceae bacterium]
MPPAATQRVGTSSNALIDGSPLSINQVAAIGQGHRQLQLSEDAALRERITAAAELVDHAVEKGWPVYGVTTGFGGMSNLAVPCDQAAASQQNLLSFLATGAGSPIDPRHVRAAMALRANVLMQGYSGVRLEIIQRLITYLNRGATPVVRELGSIGASGDLVPLSVIARAITGHSNFVKVQIDGRTLDGPAALRELDLEPIELRPKEGLALVNGTSFSSAIAANCVAEARRLMALAFGAQAIMLRALNVQDEPFAAFVHQRKPHQGQVWSAKIMQRLLNEGRESLNGSAHKELPSEHIQDRYSLRC